jgi:hypothetical protein
MAARTESTMITVRKRPSVEMVDLLDVAVEIELEGEG